MKLNVIDSIMGSGKTSWAIDKMNNDNGIKVVYGGNSYYYKLP